MLKRKANMEQFNNLYTELYKNVMNILMFRSSISWLIDSESYMFHCNHLLLRINVTTYESLILSWLAKTLHYIVYHKWVSTNVHGLKELMVLKLF